MITERTDITGQPDRTSRFVWALLAVAGAILAIGGFYRLFGG